MIANIILLAAALWGLLAMSRWDLNALQQNAYSNSRYNAWLRESGDFTSTKRLAVLAILIARFTTMAQASWMVVMILAAALIGLAQVITMRLKRQEQPVRLEVRAVRRLVLIMALALVAITGVIFLGKSLNETDILRPASMIAVMTIAVSPLLTMLANWLLGLIEKRPENDTSDTSKNEETEN